MINTLYIPRTEDLLATLNGGERFSELDLSHTYQQLVFNEGSRKYLTVNTCKGLFQPTCLKYGIHSAAGIFQREMEKHLSHVPFTVSKINDILVSGKNDNEHFQNLESVSKNHVKMWFAIKKEKSHTCQEGGAHLRISFWHLLMNLKNK